MRWLLALSLAGCVHATSAPAWPKAHAPAEDGGQSLAPRSPVYSRTEASGDDASADDHAAGSPAQSSRTGGAPAATPGDIVIDVDGD